MRPLLRGRDVGVVPYSAGESKGRVRRWVVIGGGWGRLEGTFYEGILMEEVRGGIPP